jgi:hypothetical protein
MKKSQEKALKEKQKNDRLIPRESAAVQERRLYLKGRRANEQNPLQF